MLPKAKIAKTQIASIVGISRATLYRELKRGSVIQKKSNSALLTLIERKTRMGFIVKLENKTAETVAQKLKSLSLPMKSVTTDNGSEFAGLEKVLQIPVYYTHPYSSWEKGSVEGLNGLIRRFIPKGSDVLKISDEQILKVENYLNTLPLKI